MKHCLFFLLLHFLFMSPSAKADEITLHADVWCPYNCIPNTDYEGYLIDIFREIFEPEGHQVLYSLLPWSRTLLLTRRNENIVAVGAYVRDDDELILPEKHVGVSVISIMTLKSSSWKYRDIESLKDIRLGVIKGYSYGLQVDEFLEDNPRNLYYLHGVEPAKQGLRMLSEDRLDALMDDRNVLLERARKSGMGRTIKFVGDVAIPNNVYFAFSPMGSKGRQYAKQFSAGIEKLRTSGRLKIILDKYGLKDWAQ